MEGPKIIDLGKKKLEKANEKKRTHIETTPEGDFRYPEARIELTEAEALEVAHAVVEKYSHADALFDDFKSRHSGSDTYGLGDPQASPARTLMERSLANQRGYAAGSTTESLLRILDIHKKDPKHYYGTLIFAMSEEFVRRFMPQGGHAG